MAVSNDQRVGKALELLKYGLRPYVEREMRAAYGQHWVNEARNSFRDGRLPLDAKGAVNWDSYALLAVTAGQRNMVFSKRLGRAERNLVEELRSTRNDWAHQKSFSADDTYRALGSIEKLLNAIGSESEASAVKILRREALEELTRVENLGLSTNSNTPEAARLTRASSNLTSRDTDGVKGKYRPLHVHLMRHRDGDLTMTFEEVEKALGSALPPSAFKYQAWWANENLDKTVMVQKRAWLVAGFYAYPDLKRKAGRVQTSKKVATEARPD
jgi:hypothetical protein